MAVVPTKIRVGACDLVLVDASGTSPIDLGATEGGATLTYNATYLEPDIDQSLLGIVAYKTKEEISWKANLPQISAANLQVALSLAASNVTTTAAGTLGTSPTCIVTPTNGATGSYSYQVVPYTNAGDGVPATATNITTGPATLSATAYNTISWTTLPANCTGVRIVRTAAPGAQGTGLLATIPGWTLPGSWVDNGSVAPTAYTPSGTPPATPNVSQVSFGGNPLVVTHTLDWAVPKNDGTANHWLGHLYSVYSSKSIGLDYAKTKASELASVEFAALANLSQPVGQQAGYLAEQF